MFARVRPAGESDREFVREMARLACGLDDRPLPSADNPAVLALLPGSMDLGVVAVDQTDRRLGACWCHFHEPPLVLDDRGEALPEVTLAVREEARGQGLGGRMLEALTADAAERYSGLALNVHLRNPAVRLYIRSGFKVAGKGRGPYGVAMGRSLGRSTRGVRS